MSRTAKQRCSQRKDDLLLILLNFLLDKILEKSAFTFTINGIREARQLEKKKNYTCNIYEIITATAESL